MGRGKMASTVPCGGTSCHEVKTDLSSKAAPLLRAHAEFHVTSLSRNTSAPETVALDARDQRPTCSWLLRIRALEGV